MRLIMLRFISEENYSMHVEYVNALKVKLSALTKIVPALDRPEALSAKRRTRDRELLNGIKLIGEIRLHEACFKSFGEREFQRSVGAERAFGSSAELLGRLCKLAIGIPYGFVGVTVDKKRRINVFSLTDFAQLESSVTPVLAVDVCEHAYFMDYGFDKERYLKRALAYLSVERLDVFS